MAMNITDIIKRLKDLPEYPGTRKKMVENGVYYYILEPGDKTRYDIMVTPLSDDMCRTQHVPFGSVMFTFMLSNITRSIPVTLEQPWDVGYFRSHIEITDPYTSVAFHSLMLYVADDILTDRRNNILEESNEDSRSTEGT